MESQIKRILETLKDHEKRIANLEKIPEGAASRSEKGVSIKEFIIQKTPTTAVEKTLVIGYYLEHYRGISPFTTRDLEDVFREAKEIVPGNINRAVIGNISNGHMMEAKERKNGLKSWTLTSTGERTVEGQPKD